MHYLNNLLGTNTTFGNRLILITSSQVKGQILNYRFEHQIVDNLKIYTENEFIKTHIYSENLKLINQLMTSYDLKKQAATSIISSKAIAKHLGISIPVLDNYQISDEPVINLSVPTNYEIYKYSTKQSDYFQLAADFICDLSSSKVDDSLQITKYNHYLTEIEDNIESIYNLLLNDIDLKQIHVYMPQNYISLFTQVATNYNIPIATTEEVGLIQTKLGRNMYNHFIATNEITLTEDPLLDECIINTVNKIKEHSDDLVLYKQLLCEMFKQAKVTISKKTGLKLNTTIDTKFTSEQYANDYLFSLGNYQDGLISYRANDQIIDDAKRVGTCLHTSSQINQKINQDYISIISSFDKKLISYSDKIVDNSVELANNLVSYDVKAKEIQYKNYSRANNRLGFARADYTRQVYGIENNVYSQLKSSIKLDKYDNQYQGITSSIDPMQLSYTSVNNFYKCQYRFYLENVLRIKNGAFDCRRVYVGNLIHHVLEVVDFNQLLTSEQILIIMETYLKDNNIVLDKVDKLYTTKFANYLEQICQLIKADDEMLGYSKLEREVGYELELRDEYKLVGKIDKILSKIDGEDLIVEIVDYKTGALNINFDHIDFGLDMQNLIYYLLIKNELRYEEGSVIMRGTFQHQIKPKVLFDHQDVMDTTKLKGYAQFKNDSEIKRTQKIIANSEIETLTETVKLKIDNVVDQTIDRNFTINPKRIDGKDVSCSHCKYAQICNKSYKNTVYLSKGK